PTNPARGSTTARRGSGRAARTRSSSCVIIPMSRPRSTPRCAQGTWPSVPKARTVRKASPRAKQLGSPYEAAVQFLGNRPRSVSEIRRHLRSKRYDDEAIDGAVDKLRAQRYRSEEHTSELQSRVDLVC